MMIFCNWSVASSAAALYTSKCLLSYPNREQVFTRMTIPAIKLTSLASAAGCAAKFGPGDLSEFVFPLTRLFDPSNYPNLLVGLSEPDDAGVIKLNDEQAIIMTTDFFPPVVDDPYW